MVTLPEGCILIADRTVFLPSPVSPIQDPPEDWPSRKSTQMDLMQDLNTVEILQHEAEDVLASTVIDDDTSPGLLTFIWHKIEEVTGKVWFQVTCGLVLMGVTVYCCCAPASWPRFNCCLSCIPTCIDCLATCIQSSVGAIRRYRHATREPHCQQATVGRLSRGIEELTPLEAEIQMARIQSPPRLALTHM